MPLVSACGYSFVSPIVASRTKRCKLACASIFHLSRSHSCWSYWLCGVILPPIVGQRSGMFPLVSSLFLGVKPLFPQLGLALKQRLCAFMPIGRLLLKRHACKFLLNPRRPLMHHLHAIKAPLLSVLGPHIPISPMVNEFQETGNRISYSRHYTMKYASD